MLQNFNVTVCQWLWCVCNTFVMFRTWQFMLVYVGESYLLLVCCCTVSEVAGTFFHANMDRTRDMRRHLKTKDSQQQNKMEALRFKEEFQVLRVLCIYTFILLHLFLSPSSSEAFDKPALRCITANNCHSLVELSRLLWSFFPFLSCLIFSTVDLLYSNGQMCVSRLL